MSFNSSQGDMHQLEVDIDDNCIPFSALIIQFVTERNHVLRTNLCRAYLGKLHDNRLKYQS